MDCEYCAKFGNTNVLEHIVNKKSFYCKRCGNSFGEDEFKTKIQAEFDKQAEKLAKETAKQLDEGKQVDVETLEKKVGVEINDASLIVEDVKKDDMKAGGFPLTVVKETKNEDQTYTADDKKKRFIKKK